MDLATLILIALSLVVSSVLCVLMRDLLKAAIALALVSALLTVLMFLNGATLAAVFELSVCTGLITVTFVSAISLTRTETDEESAWKPRERLRRFIWLPFLLAAVAAGMLAILWPYIDFGLADPTRHAPTREAVQQVLWNQRRFDILGQIGVLLAGVFGIVTLFRKEDEGL
jgi:NADH:ubiquinone oxidoreductase subunit 6 (subunit J)